MKWVKEAAKQPVALLRNLSMKHWSEQTIIALVMQTRDNSITVRGKKGVFGHGLTSEPGHGEPNPTWIPQGHEAVRRLANNYKGGFAGGGWNDVFNIPMTAHFLGGAVIGDSVATGVIDAYHRVFNYPGLHVVDGSAISANLGVNPSLTITAQAERAMSFWPNKGDADSRPAPDAAYERIEPIAPHAPVVPPHAPGALRFSRRRPQ